METLIWSELVAQFFWDRLRLAFTIDANQGRLSRRQQLTLPADLIYVFKLDPPANLGMTVNRQNVIVPGWLAIADTQAGHDHELATSFHIPVGNATPAKQLGACHLHPS